MVEGKASLMKPMHHSLITIKRLCLWCPIMKKKEIIMSIHVCPYWWMSIDSKENGWKKSFSYETSVSLSFILAWRMCSWCLIMKRKKIITCIHVCCNWWISFDSKKMVERKAFFSKPKHHYHLSQWGEYVYGAQSRIKRRLLCESQFVLIDGWTLI